MFGGGEIAEMYVDIGARLDKLDRGLSSAEAKLRAAGSRMDGHSRRMNRSIGMIGATGATVGLLAVGVAFGKVARAGVDLDRTFTELQSKTGATRREMEAFRKTAVETSTHTRYSAGEAARAQLELAKAGLSTSQILGGGLAAALDLAAAGNVSLEESSVTAARAMGLFKMKAADLPRVADAFSNAANATTGDVHDMADAMKMGGGAAKAAGLSFNETMVALTLLGKAGYLGSDAGTSLKTTLLQLSGPSTVAKKVIDDLGLSFFNAQGQMRPLGQVSDMLREKTSKLTQEERLAAFSKIAGADGVRTLLALYDAGSKKIDAYTRVVTKEGEAHRIASRMNQTAEGELRRLGNTAEAVGLKFSGKMMPYVKEGAAAIADSLGGALTDGTIDRWSDMTITAVGNVKGAFEDIGDLDLAGAFGRLSDVLTPVVSDAEALRNAMEAAADAAKDLNPARNTESAAGADVATAKVAVRQARKDMEGLVYGTDRWRVGMARVTHATVRLQTAQERLKKAAQDASTQTHEKQSELQMGRFAKAVDDSHAKVARLRSKLKELEANPGPMTNADADIIRTKELPAALAEATAAEKRWAQATADANLVGREHYKTLANHARALQGMPALSDKAQAALGRLTMAPALDRMPTQRRQFTENIVKWSVKSNADVEIPRLKALMDLATKAGKGSTAVKIVANAGSAKEAIKGLLGLFPKVKAGATARVGAKVNGTGDVDALIAAIARVVGKSVSINVTRYWREVGKPLEGLGTGGTRVGLATGAVRRDGMVTGTAGGDVVPALIKPGERVVNAWQWDLIRSGVDPDRAMNMTGAVKLAKGGRVPAKRKGESDDDYRGRVSTWGGNLLDADERAISLSARRHDRMQRALERDGWTSAADLKKIAAWDRDEAKQYRGAAGHATRLAAQAKALGFHDLEREWSQRARDLRESAKDKIADAKDTAARTPDAKPTKRDKGLSELLDTSTPLGKEWANAQLAAAKAATTTDTADDLAALRTQKGILTRLIGTTKSRGALTEAYNELGSVQDRIKGLEDAAKQDSSPSSSGGDSSPSGDSGGYSGGSYGGGPATVTLQQYITVQGNVWTTSEFAKALRDEFVKMGREMGGGLWAGVG